MIKLFTFLVCATLFASTTTQYTWVAIGDSITYLNDHPDEAGNRITKGYLTLVTEKYPNISVVNKGYNGWTSGNIAGKFDELAIQKADIYSIFLGTNDWWQGRPIGKFSDYKKNTGNETIYGSFRIIINKLRALNSQAQIILITPMQRGDFVYLGGMKNNAYGSYREKNDQMLEAVASAIKRIGTHEKFAVVDLFHDSGMTLDNMVRYKRLKDPVTGAYKDYTYPEYTKIPFNPEGDEYPYPADAVDMTYDGLHPSDRGYKIISSMVEEVIKH